jgi:hypothetical protein
MQFTNKFKRVFDTQQSSTTTTIQLYYLFRGEEPYWSVDARIQVVIEVLSERGEEKSKSMVEDTCGPSTLVPNLTMLHPHHNAFKI